MSNGSHYATDLGRRLDPEIKSYCLDIFKSDDKQARIYDENIGRMPDPNGLPDQIDIRSHLMMCYLKTFIKPQIRVAILVQPSADLFALMFALWCLGAIVVPLNLKSTEIELKTVISGLSPDVVIVDTSLFGSHDLDNRPWMKSFLPCVQGILTWLKSPECSQIKALDINRWVERVTKEQAMQDEVVFSFEAVISHLAYQPEQPVLILMTGGSTGAPKMVEISALAFTSSLRHIQDSYHFNHKDKTFLLMPLYHGHGLMTTTSAILCGRSDVIMLRGGFDPKCFEDKLKKWEPTWLTAVPTIYQLMVEYPGSSEPSTLRFLRSCSSPLKPALRERLGKRFPGVPISQAYGATEGAHQICHQSIYHEPEVVDSVGKWNEEYITVKLYHENGKPFTAEDYASGKTGDVALRGHQVSKPKALGSQVPSKDENDLYLIGDCGSISPNGELVLTGRKSDFINRGGEKINPSEVEQFIEANSPLITQCMVFGTEDDHWGEVPHCVLIYRGDNSPDTVIEEIKSALRNRLASYKQPVQYHVRTSMLTTAVGKVSRTMVRDWIIHQKYQNPSA